MALAAVGSSTPQPRDLQLTFLRALRAPFGSCLRSLRLHHNGHTDALPIHTAVASIATLATLEDLRLCGWPINDVHAEQLGRGLPAVRTLILSRSRVASRGVIALGDGMRQLVYLDLRHGTELTGDGFGVFRRLNAPLHTLVLSACPKLDSAHLRTLAGIQNLHWLDLSLSPVRAHDLRNLRRSLTLRKLVLRGCPTLYAVPALQALQEVRHLHTIDLTGCLLDDPTTPVRRAVAVQGPGSTGAAFARNMAALRLPGWGGHMGPDRGALLEPRSAQDAVDRLRRAFAKVLVQQPNVMGATPVLVDMFV
jgi:hypothetical protein